MAQWRRPTSRLLFGAACLLLGGALALLLSAWTLPSEGLQDLGRLVGAMLFAALATIPFGLALLVGRGTSMPGWMVAVSVGGLLLGLVPAVSLLSVRLAG